MAQIGQHRGFPRAACPHSRIRRRWLPAIQIRRQVERRGNIVRSFAYNPDKHTCGQWQRQCKPKRRIPHRRRVGTPHRLPHKLQRHRRLRHSACALPQLYLRARHLLPRGLRPDRYHGRGQAVVAVVQCGPLRQRQGRIHQIAAAGRLAVPPRELHRHTRLEQPQIRSGRRSRNFRRDKSRRYPGHSDMERHHPFCKYTGTSRRTELQPLDHHQPGRTYRHRRGLLHTYS